MRWLLWNVDWSLENNRIHCSSGASLQATGLAHEMHGRRQLPQSGLVHCPADGFADVVNAARMVRRKGQLLRDRLAPLRNSERGAEHESEDKAWAGSNHKTSERKYTSSTKGLARRRDHATFQFVVHLRANSAFARGYLKMRWLNRYRLLSHSVLSWAFPSTCQMCGTP